MSGIIIVIVWFSSWGFLFLLLIMYLNNNCNKKNTLYGSNVHFNQQTLQNF